MKNELYRATFAASAIVFVLSFLNYAYFYQGGGPNQFSRYALTASLAEHGSVEIGSYHHLTIDKAVKDGWKPGETLEFAKFAMPEIGRDFDLAPDGLTAAVAMAESQVRICRLAEKTG